MLKNNFKIYDNFLSDSDFLEIKNSLMSESFPWYFSNEKTHGIDNVYNYQFYHIFYQNYSINSSLFNILDPLIIKINPLSIIKIKANLTPNFDKFINYGFHNDLEEQCITAVYYINSNNGKTLFESGESIDSVENRLLLFNSKIKHAGTSCTDEKTRVLLNLNFIERKK